MAVVLGRKGGGSGGGGGAPSGPAGGSLGGTYPNPSIANLAVDTAQIAAGAITAAKVAADVATQSELDAVATASVAKALYDANTVLAADTDNTPAALTMGASTMLSRLAAGNIKAASVAEIRTLLGIPTLVSDKVKLTGGNITTGSATFVDLTGVTLTVTTGARRVLLVFTGEWNATAAGRGNYLDLAVDGTRQGGSNGLHYTTFDANYDEPASISFVTDVLSAASHTFKAMWRTSNATATFYADATNPITFAAVELPS